MNNFIYLYIVGLYGFVSCASYASCATPGARIEGPIASFPAAVDVGVGDIGLFQAQLRGIVGRSDVDVDVYSRFQGKVSHELRWFSSLHFISSMDVCWMIFFCFEFLINEDDINDI